MKTQHDHEHKHSCDCDHGGAHEHNTGCNCHGEHKHSCDCDHGHDHEHNHNGACDCGHDHKHNHSGDCDCGHDHSHAREITAEEGAEPTVVSLARELAGDIFSVDELVRRAARIAYTLTAVLSEKKILIGHIKLQIIEDEERGLFVSATSLDNITMKTAGDFAEPGRDAPEHYALGLTAIVFGMPEEHAASLTAGIVDGILRCPF